MPGLFVQNPPFFLVFQGAIWVGFINKVFSGQTSKAVLGSFSSSFAKKMLDESGKTGYDVVGYNL